MFTILFHLVRVLGVTVLTFDLRLMAAPIKEADIRVFSSGRVVDGSAAPTAVRVMVCVFGEGYLVRIANPGQQ